MPVSRNDLIKKGKPVNRVYGANQDRILGFLKQGNNAKHAFTQRELAEKLDIPEPRINSGLHALEKKNLVFRRDMMGKAKNGTSKVLQHWTFTEIDTKK